MRQFCCGKGVTEPRTLLLCLTKGRGMERQHTETLASHLGVWRERKGEEPRIRHNTRRWQSSAGTKWDLGHPALTLLRENNTVTGKFQDDSYTSTVLSKHDHIWRIFLGNHLAPFKRCEKRRKNGIITAIFMDFPAFFVCFSS